MSEAADLLEDFRAEFPEFNPTDWTDASAIRALDTALDIHRLSPKATIYCAAHNMAVRKSEISGTDVGAVDGGSGLVNSKKLGEREVRFSQGLQGLTSKDTQRRIEFARTSCGRTFLLLEDRATAGRVRVIG